MEKSQQPYNNYDVYSIIAIHLESFIFATSRNAEKNRSREDCKRVRLR